MRFLISLFPLIFIFTTPIAHAADYYYCDCQAGASSQCAKGSDVNNIGTNPTTPRQTFANAVSRFSGLNGGDSLKFCRGGSFSRNSKATWVNSKSTQTSPILITDYIPSGQSADSRPIITQKSDNRLFSLADGGNADHEEGYTFSNLDLRCTACTTNGSADGFFFYNDIDYVTIDNVSLDGFRLGINLGKSNPANPGSNAQQDYITIKNVNITNSKRQGLAGGAYNLLVEDSYLENNGSGTIYDHNIYISTGSNIVLRGNELFRSSVDSTNSCVGVPLVVHGRIDNLVIENNTIREDIGKATANCWGLTVDNGYPVSEFFRNVRIRGNKIINVRGIGIGVTSCDNCIIENNVILSQQAGSITAISAPNKTRGAEDSPLNNVTIRNNSIYITSSGTGISLGREGSQHTIVSNAIYYSGTGDFNCLNASLSASAYTAIDNNICYFPNASGSSEWNNGSGNQTPVGANSQNIDPGFTNPSLPNVDFSLLSSTSGAVGAGHNTLSATKDFRGKTRDGQPDAGAFEFGTFNPPAKTNLYLN